MQDKLKELDLHVEYSEAEDREPIDFEIRNEADELCATVWGSNPFNDVQIDCNHPEEAIDYHYDDDGRQGRCEICGAVCYVGYLASADDGYTINEPFVMEWYPAKKIGGIVGEYLEELRKEF